MTIFLCMLLVCVLLRSVTAMTAATVAARLFVTSVMPGLFPYMTLALMLTSRLSADVPDSVLILMGWCGGSPTGAKLISARSELPRSVQKRIALTCATMSPMFLVGTIPQWMGSMQTGACLLAAMLAGGALVGVIARRSEQTGGQIVDNVARPEQLTLGDAVEQASRTMLVVCGTMMLLRVMASLVGELFTGSPVMGITVMTLLEVTSGTEAIAGLPLSIAVRTGLIGAATGFGGAAILLQNRACYPDDLLSLREQVGWQALHGLTSGALAYLLMRICG